MARPAGPKVQLILSFLLGDDSACPIRLTLGEPTEIANVEQLLDELRERRWHALSLDDPLARERVLETAPREFGPLGRPPAQLLDYVAWRLGISWDSFRGKLLRAVPHADGNSYALLRAAFPDLVRAYEAWQESEDGEFELPLPEDRTAAACGCEVAPGRPMSYGEIRAHRQHTEQAVFIWVLLMRRDGQDHAASERLMDLLHQLRDALDEHFPESQSLSPDA